MKKTLLLLLLAMAGIRSAAQAPAPDSVVHRAFRSLQQKDSASFIRLFPDVRQMKGLMRQVMEGMKDQLRVLAPDKNVDSLIAAELEKITEESYRNEMIVSFAETFHQTLEQAQRRKLDLAKARVLSVTVDSSAAEKMQGIRSVNGVVDFGLGDSVYQLRYEGVAYLPEERGWFGTRFTGLRKKGEQWPVEEVETEIRDVELGTMEDAPPPPPPPPPPKKKTTPKKAPVKKPTSAPKKKPATGTKPRTQS